MTGDYHPAFWPMFGPKKYTTSEDEADLEKVKEASYKAIDKVVSHLDSLLEGKDHVYKDKKTVLDPYAFILTRWTTMTPKSWKEYPNLVKFMERMEKDEAVQIVLELHDK